MQANNLLRLTLDPSTLFARMGLTADPWQRDFLLSPHRRHLLICSRGAGKSRVVSVLAAHTALFLPKSLILLVAKAQRQAQELMRYCKQVLRAADLVPLIKDNQQEVELANESRIVSLPSTEATIRGYQGVGLLILDEAARIPDELYYTVRGMLLTSGGRLIALTTPFGRRGWFHEEWERGGAQFTRTKIPWQQCPRIKPEDIDAERRSMGDMWVAQEYEVAFAALEGLVYPDFDQAIDEELDLPPPGRKVGGIDFGWRNPFAAIWGTLDHDDVLWIAGERYLKETPLWKHRAALKELGNIQWYADPAGAVDIAELRAADLKVRRGDNAIRAGIACVNGRIQSGRLRVSRKHCPNLIWESKLYRYPSPSERAALGENPVDSDNHALAALRYLVSRIDMRVMAKLKGSQRPADEPAPPAVQPPGRGRKPSAWIDESLWEIQ